MLTLVECIAALESINFCNGYCLHCILVTLKMYGQQAQCNIIRAATRKTWFGLFTHILFFIIFFFYSRQFSILICKSTKLIRYALQLKYVKLYNYAPINIVTISIWIIYSFKCMHYASVGEAYAPESTALSHSHRNYQLIENFSIQSKIYFPNFPINCGPGIRSKIAHRPDIPLILEYSYFQYLHKTDVCWFRI